jgi:hypothetical protein
MVLLCDSYRVPPDTPRATRPFTKTQSVPCSTLTRKRQKQATGDIYDFHQHRRTDCRRCASAGDESRIPTLTFGESPFKKIGRLLPYTPRLRYDRMRAPPPRRDANQSQNIGNPMNETTPRSKPPSEFVHREFARGPLDSPTSCSTTLPFTRSRTQFSQSCKTPVHNCPARVPRNLTLCVRQTARDSRRPPSRY